MEIIMLAVVGSVSQLIGCLLCILFALDYWVYKTRAPIIPAVYPGEAFPTEQPVCHEAK